MIAPRSRLLWWTGGWLVPIAILSAVAPHWTAVCLAAGALLMLIPVFDIFLTTALLDEIGVELPDVVRLTKGAEGEIEVRISNKSARSKRIRLGLPLPKELGCEEDSFDVDLPADSEWSRVSLKCLPWERGPRRLDRCYLGAASRLGFWMKRVEREIRTDVRVYPNLKRERRHLAALFLNRGGFGIHAQRQIGQGRDFEKLREYIPGDSYDEIHWKATAKRGRPVTKIFQIERTHEVYVIVDSSRLSGRRPEKSPSRIVSRLDALEGRSPSEVESTSLERFVSAALIMAIVTERQGDLFGVMSFSDRVDNFVRAKNGREHYRRCRDALYALQPKTVAPDFSELFSCIRMRLRRRALLVFLTALDDPIIAESFAENIPMIARQHLVLVNMIQPPGVHPVFSDPEARTIEDIYRDLSGHQQWARLQELQTILRYRGVQFRLLQDESFCPQLVSQYISVKQRQLL